MDVEGVRRDARYGSHGVLIGAEEVADVAQQPEVVVGYGVDELFDALAVLAEAPVVLDCGADAFSFGVGSYFAASLYKSWQRAFEAVIHSTLRVTGRCIVAHRFCTERRGYVDH